MGDESGLALIECQESPSTGISILLDKATLMGRFLDICRRAISNDLILRISIYPKHKDSFNILPS